MFLSIHHFHVVYWTQSLFSRHNEVVNCWPGRGGTILVFTPRRATRLSTGGQSPACANQGFCDGGDNRGFASKNDNHGRRQNSMGRPCRMMRVEKGRQVFPCTERFHPLYQDCSVLSAQCSMLCLYPFTNLLSGSTALTNAHETGADLLDIWVNFAAIIGIIGITHQHSSFPTQLGHTLDNSPLNNQLCLGML